MRYRLIALDLDGTLLARNGRISPANAHAIRRAQEQGILVVPNTGRCWQESLQALEGFDPGPLNLGVFVTGAAICEITTGRVVHSTEMDPELAYTVVQELLTAPDAVLVFRNREKAGHDYLITGKGALTQNTRWWFKTNLLPVHHQPTVTPADLAHALRVGMVTPASYARRCVEHLQAQLGDRIVVHSFEALHMPGQPEPLDVLEIFAAGVDKWQGLAWIARQQGIQPQEIAVMGDQINDLQMMRGAGCCIAMGNAVASVRDQAHHVTLDCDADGVAHAIDRLLKGEWGK